MRSRVLHYSPCAFPLGIKVVSLESTLLPAVLARLLRSLCVAHWPAGKAPQVLLKVVCREGLS